jgi:2-amino-4-hydroxy-6-hydroxymethyldihydropteridine diphosphokinase
VHALCRSVHAVIGIGSNLGDRLERMRAAVRRLSKFSRVERLSHVYETSPVGGPEGQPLYLNAAILIDYAGQPLDLLDALQGVEAALGRVRDERWGARTIDLDILWVDGFVTEGDRLTVPHALLLERPFALRPLIDVAPDAIDPMSQLPYTRLVDQETAMMRPTEHELAEPS